MDHVQNLEQGLLGNTIQFWLLRHGFAEDHKSEMKPDREHQQMGQSLNRKEDQQLGRSTSPQPVRQLNRPASRSVNR